jgi:hypothetical protein
VAIDLMTMKLGDFISNLKFNAASPSDLDQWPYTVNPEGRTSVGYHANVCACRFPLTVDRPSASPPDFVQTDPTCQNHHPLVGRFTAALAATDMTL